MDPLDQLENKSIYLIREAYARFHGSLAMLWSMGKDSTALLWLVRKALVGFNKAIYDEIDAEMAELLSQVGIAQFTCVPVSAFYGINVVKKSAEMAWYTGPTLLEALDTLRFKPFTLRSLRFPVQDVYDMDDGPVLVGRVESGEIVRGMALELLPGGGTVRVKEIRKFPERDLDRAGFGESIGLVKMRHSRWRGYRSLNKISSVERRIT